MLVLLDIDGTLLTARGAGSESMVAAGRALFGETFHDEGVDYAGRLDPQIYRDMCAVSGVDDADAHHDRFLDAYVECMTDRLTRPPSPEALPGALELVDALAAKDGVRLGVLTGNYEPTGKLKLAAAGFDPARFVVGAWGGDGATRDDLVPIAVERHRAATGESFEAERVVVVGDTPHDIACARAADARVLAVATGFYPLHDLMPLWPDLVLEDLTDTDEVVSWILDA